MKTQMHNELSVNSPLSDRVPLSVGDHTKTHE